MSVSARRTQRAGGTIRPSLLPRLFSCALPILLALVATDASADYCAVSVPGGGCEISCDGGCECVDTGPPGDDPSKGECVCYCTGSTGSSRGQRNISLNWRGPASNLLKNPKTQSALSRILPPDLINVLRTTDKPINVKLNNQPVGAVATELRRQLGLPTR